MAVDLTKREKKIARELIEKGVQAEYQAALEEVKKVITNWENGTLDNKAGYLKLFKTVKEHDKLIARRYDHITGSNYLLTVAAILFDEQISKEAIQGFSEEAKRSIHNWIAFWNEKTNEADSK